jgi:hypothetical protein
MKDQENKTFDLDSIIEAAALILGLPSVDLSFVNIGETGPLTSYYGSKCCCFHEIEKVEDKEEE